MTVHISSMKTIVLKEKEFFISEPYTPNHSATVGREEETALIMAAWAARSDLAPLNPMLTGAPGVGKNRLVYDCARICNKPLFVMQSHEDLTPEDLACSVRFSDNKDRKMDYILSPLVTAMITGSIFLLDELDKMRPKAMAMLSSLLDERRHIDSNILGFRVKAHPEFRFIAAANTMGSDGSIIPDYIQSRLFPIIRMDNMSRAEIESVVRHRHSMPNRAWEKAISAFWMLHRKNDLQPTPRSALSVFSLAANLAASKHTDGSILSAHIEKAFSLLSGSRNA